jgi:hypothetical protein
MQLLGDELLGEPPWKVHEVVGGDASGDGDWHEGFPCLVISDAVKRQSSTVVGSGFRAPRGDLTDTTGW